MRRMRSKTINLSTAFLTLPAAIALSACAGDGERMYCGDEHRYVIEQERCEDGSSGVFIYHGYWSATVQPGHQLSQTGLEGRVLANDPNARANAGLPRTGGFGGNGAKFSTGG